MRCSLPVRFAAFVTAMIVCGLCCDAWAQEEDEHAGGVPARLEQLRRELGALEERIEERLGATREHMVERVREWWEEEAEPRLRGRRGEEDLLDRAVRLEFALTPAEERVALPCATRECRLERRFEMEQSVGRIFIEARLRPLDDQSGDVLFAGQVRVETVERGKGEQSCSGTVSCVLVPGKRVPLLQFGKNALDVMMAPVE